MRIAVIGDTHLGRTLYGYDMSYKIRSMMYRFVEFCLEHQVDAAVHLGDMYDNPRPSLDTEKWALQWCNEFERAKIPLFIIAGNHDVNSAGEAASALEPIKVAPYQYVHAIDRVSVVNNMLFLPFPSPKIYRDEEVWLEAIEEAMSSITKLPIDVFAHLSVVGADLNGQEWVYRGGKFQLPNIVVEDPRVGVCYCGHIHLMQEPRNNGYFVDGSPAYISIIGAAQRLRFSERDNPVVFVLIDSQKKVRGFTQAAVKMIQADVTADRLQDALSLEVERALVKLNVQIGKGDTCDTSTIVEELYRLGAEFVCVKTVTASVELRDDPGRVVGREPLRVAADFIGRKFKDLPIDDRKAIYKRFKQVHRTVSTYPTAQK